MALPFLSGKRQVLVTSPREDGDHACAACGADDFVARRRRSLRYRGVAASGGDGGAELNLLFERAALLSAVGESRLYEASLALLSDHETGSEP